LIDNPIATKCLYHDVDGGIWLGSYYRGVYYCPLEKNSFENIPLGAITNDLQVSCIGESTDGKIWIYVLGMGIYIYDRSENKISHLDFDPDPNGSGIKKIFFSQDGETIWFGLNAGLSEFNLKTGKSLFSYPFRRNTQPHFTEYGLACSIFKFEDKHLLAIISKAVFDRHSRPLLTTDKMVRNGFFINAVVHDFVRSYLSHPTA